MANKGKGHETSRDVLAQIPAREQKVMEADLKAVSEWLKCKPSQLSLRQARLPAAYFQDLVTDLIGSYTEFPDDKHRMEKILRKIEAGDPALPVFIEEDDPHLFIMEGRHRIVSFFMAGMKDIPVIFASSLKPEPSIEASPVP